MARRVAATIGCGSPEECAEALGSRWAYVLTVVGLSVGGGSLAPGEPMDLPQRMVVHGELMHVARRKGWRKPYLEAAHRREGVEWGRGIAEETILDAEYFFEHGPGAVTGGTLGGEGVSPEGGCGGCPT